MTRDGHGQKAGYHESGAERASRWLRNINALGTLAFGAAAVLAPPLPQAALGVLAGVNAAQAGGFEWLRRRAQTSRRQSH